MSAGSFVVARASMSRTLAFVGARSSPPTNAAPNLLVPEIRPLPVLVVATTVTPLAMA